MQADSDAGRSNQSVSAFPISFNTQSRLINQALDGDNLTISLTALGKMFRKNKVCFVFVYETKQPAVWYLKLLTPVHV